MLILGLLLLAIAVLEGAYVYVGYPLILLAMPVGWRQGGGGPVGDGDSAAWPFVSITLAAYNEEKVLGATLRTLLEVDYPHDRRQIIVVSDASTDRTDSIARSFEEQGVELLRLPQRSGKTAAENASRARIRGEIVVNTDASVRVAPDALKPLVAVFRDPTVGVASGRDVSVGGDSTQNQGESGYVGYEMWVRDLETRAGGIVGASGCFYASRRELHGKIVPAALSRDFAAPLIAQENGFRSVSVSDAVCFVPRTSSLRREYRRKVRTMARGLDTLYYKRHLLNPIRHGRFAWMLLSHKLARWLIPWAAVLGLLGAVLVALQLPTVGLVVAAGLVAATAGAMAIAWWWPARRAMPRILAVPAYVLFGLLAGVHAWSKALRQDLNPVWEPTRR
jgi:cellulose synthase/poly-beta-1,6-N-acetylglucosamine synthase-like glycosyltransferase